MFANAINTTSEGRCGRPDPDEAGAMRRAMKGGRGGPGGGHRRHRHRGFGPGGGGFGGFPGGGGPRGRGRKARRGDIRTAALLLLAEEPRNGYQIMQEVEERSDGVWSPSPGSVYPALAQLEDEGLIRSEEADGRKLFALTDAGRRPGRGARRGQAGAVGADERRRQRRGARAGQADARGRLRLRPGDAHRQRGADAPAPARCSATARRDLYRILADGEPETLRWRTTLVLPASCPAIRTPHPTAT